MQGLSYTKNAAATPSCKTLVSAKVAAPVALPVCPSFNVGS